MAKYTPATIAKALVAFGVAAVGAAAASAGGADLSVLDAGQWITALGTGLVAGGGVFATPNKADGAPASPADTAITGIQQTVQNVADAAGELDRVRQAAGDVLGNLPVVGGLAEQLINGIHLP